MIEILKMIILGIVQGITEFLPISSSGHLIVFENLLGLEEPGLFVAQMLHFGTFLSVFIVFWKDIKNIIIEFFKMIISIFKREKFSLNGTQKMGLNIIIASIPTAIIAFGFEDSFKVYYENLKFVAIMFLVTAFLLFIIDKGKKGHKSSESLSYFGAFAIGSVQGIAILPGISRSGSTIFAGSQLGLKKSEAARFSFLMSLPATFGAFIFGIKDVVVAGEAISFSFPLIIGIVVAAVVGIVSIKFLINLLNKNKMSYFSIYLVIIALITFIMG